MEPPSRPWTVFILPSSHNDIGWAGTPSEIAEHRAKAIVSTVLRIMERDPTYAFAMEASLYLEEYLARRPEDRALVERFTREGRLEWGATYVQPYEGLLDGESLVRQVYEGRGWMQRSLGLDAGGYWNIDVAGRTPQLHQVLARSGVGYTVLSRNEPGLYWWEAPDGSRTLTMSLLEGAYVLSRVMSAGADWLSPMERAPGVREGQIDLNAVARELLPVLEQWAPFFDERGLPRIFLVAATADYAVPDERIRALIEQWNADPPAPVTLRFGNVRQYVDELSKGDLSRVPVRKGEWPNPWVYIHGPCHHKTVDAMRAASDQLRKAETFLAATGGCADDLHGAWRDHLYPDHGYGGLHGDGTDEVFRQRSEAALHAARGVALRAVGEIARRVPVAAGSLGNVVVFNPLSWRRDDWVEVDVAVEGHVGIEDVETQVVESAPGRVRLGFVARDVPSLGYRAFRLVPRDGAPPSGPTPLEKLVADDYVGGNPRLRARVTRGGLVGLGGLLDPDHWSGFEVVELGSPGHDVGEGEHVPEFDWRKVHPFQPTAFGLERTADRGSAPRLLEEGPLRTLVTTQSKLSHCTVGQTFALYRDLDRIDARIDVLGWDGAHGRELRLLFPPRAPGEAVEYDVPFGHARVGRDEYPGFAHLRPREVTSWISAGGTTLSTSVIAHDWLDPTAPDRTVLQAVLLATKRSCHGRGPWYEQRGDHAFTASVTGAARSIAERTRFGLERRHPLEAVVVTKGEGNALPTASWVGVDAPNVVVSALKPAEDGTGVVVRCYEVEGQETRATLAFDRPWRAARCDLLEENAGALGEASERLELSLGKHEIATIKLVS